MPDRTEPIERSLFSFIWTYSKRDQILLLCVTVLLFPLLYLTLELPKQIINGAIDAKTDVITVLGREFGQVEYLFILCGCFLVSVLAHGLLKMRINTMKGVLAERLLRRFRYSLIARILRFPQPYFERTSQGELVSMVTGESEPLGGLMGDALAQPVLQAGQMLTILYFLFAQSVTFGIAACALIPLQAWLIPKLQRQINLLNKKRVLQVRALASEIGEGAAGAGTLRVHGGWRYRLAMITDRLGRLFEIRFEIYQKKFFMKFLNNFITQLTPFLFYAIGGYLVIQGDLTLGALVAALAAYKDLASPWKELLAYYNQANDMSLRWDTITERFAPQGMIDEALFNASPDTSPNLNGDISIEDVTVLDADGAQVLSGMTTTLPGGKLIGIAAPSDEHRRAFSELLTREVVPASGRVAIGEVPLNELHQSVIARGIGHATSRPVLFQGNFGDNVLMPMRFSPLNDVAEDSISEALKVGNSTDPLNAQWLDTMRVSADSEDALIDQWCTLVQSIGGAGALFRRALDQQLNPSAHELLAQKLVSARAQIWQELDRRELTHMIYRFDPDVYNPALPVVQNFLFATPLQPLSVEELSRRIDYLSIVRGLGLDTDLRNLARDLMDALRQIFGSDGTDHPLFRKTGLDPALYQQAQVAIDRLRDEKPLDDAEEATLISVPLFVSSEQIGPAFPDAIKARILELRNTQGRILREQMADVVAPISEDAPMPNLTVLENAIYGKLSDNAGKTGDDIRQCVAEILETEGATRLVLRTVFDVPVALAGANLPATFAEPLAVSRAVIKRPQILVLDKVMASFEADSQRRMISELRSYLPDATLVILMPELDEEVNFDMTLTIQHGRLVGSGEEGGATMDSDVSTDLMRKLQALEQTDLFSGLDRKQLRLLAFGARWYEAAPDAYVFRKNDPPTDGAYMVIEGEADLIMPAAESKSGKDELIATVGAGTLVGELGLIRGEPRALDMRAKGDLLCLRIGEEEFFAVVENDSATAFKLLQVVAGYVGT